MKGKAPQTQTVPGREEEKLAMAGVICSCATKEGAHKAGAAGSRSLARTEGVAKRLNFLAPISSGSLPRSGPERSSEQIPLPTPQIAPLERIQTAPLADHDPPTTRWSNTTTVRMPRA